MDYSVVILTFNSVNHIETCLNHLTDSFSSISADYEVLVYDNGSEDGTREVLQSYSEVNHRLQVTWSERNVGTTVSRNSCLREATGKFVIVLDSDAYVNPEAIWALTEYLRSNPAVGIVVPKLVYPDGRFQISTDKFPTLFRKFKRFLFLKHMEATVKEPNADEIAKVDYAISAFWMFQRELLDSVGLLDEEIFYSPEDVDFCIRVWLAGYEIRYQPSVSVVHDAQEISRSKGVKINRFTLSHIKGMFYLFNKHRYGVFGIRSLLRRIEASLDRQRLAAEKS